MCLRFCFCLLCIMAGRYVSAQKLAVRVVDAAGSPAEIAYLRVYCHASDSTVSDYKIIRNGLILYEPKQGCPDFRMTITAPGFDAYHRQVNTVRFAGDTLVCVLSRNVTELKPVTVTADPRPILVKGDTTVYRAQAFADGTEQKLDELLRKLPGMEVNKNTGEIRFKGKPIETILLEGDNLFGANYTLGSRNINAGIVSEIQAIENYSENYVLKGLEKDDKVALNIKLVNSKMDFSGNSELGTGLIGSDKPALNLNVNTIGLNRNHKFFTTLAYNNLGYNKSPLDYFGNNYSLEQIRDRKYAAQRFIYEPSFTVPGDAARGNINSQFFGNYNGMVKLGSISTVKVNLFYLKDRITNNQQFDNEYYTGNSTIRNIDITEASKSPVTWKADIQFRHAISAKALLETSYSDASEEVGSAVNSRSNYIPLYQTMLNSINRTRKLLAGYSQRVGRGHAMLVELRAMNSSIRQQYDLYPSAFRRTVFPDDQQSSDYTREYLQLTGTLYGNRERRRYHLFVRGTLDNNQYHSAIANDSGGTKLRSFINDTRFRKHSMAQGGNFSTDNGRWQLTASYLLSLLQQQWRDPQTNGMERTDLLFEPDIRVRYRLSRIANMLFSYNYNQRSITDQYLFRNSVLQNFRNVVSNVPALDLVNTHITAINYSRTDLYNQFDYGGGITYQASNRDYLPLYLITDTLLYTNFFLTAVRNRMLDLYAYGSKYFPVLKSSLRVTFNHSVSWYYNFLSAGQLRENTNHTTSLSVFYKSIFKGKFNAENDLVYTLSTSKTADGMQIGNKSISNNTKLIFAPSRQVRMYLKGDLYLPNLSTGKGVLFLDYNLSVKPAGKRVEYSFTAHNLLDRNQFFINQVSDFSRSSFRTNTLPRNFWVSVSFLF